MSNYVMYAAIKNDGTHTVRLYRESDGEHLHSWEGCYGLDITLRDAAKLMEIGWDGMTADALSTKQER